MSATLTVVAILCHLNVAQPTLAPTSDCTAEEARSEVVVTDNELDPTLSLFSCQGGGSQRDLADWKMHSPYMPSAWRIARVTCIAGKHVPKVGA